jgi:hypothetical protein
VSAINLSCRLPIVINQYEFAFTGGFISFPSAAYQADPNGVITGSPTNISTTKATPVLSGAGGLPFYDLAMRRWLPVGAGQSSPDGGSYAYLVPSNPRSLHVVQVATGVEHVTLLPPPQPGFQWELQDFSGAAVFLSTYSSSGGFISAGVWRLDLISGSLHQLTAAQNILMVQNGTAWVGLVNPADPAPPIPGQGVAFDSIGAINLSTGKQTTWMYKPSMSVQLMAVDDAGGIVVALEPPPDFATTSIVLYQAPGVAGDVVVTTTGSGLDFAEPDHGRLWFGSGDAIYNWAPATGLKKVFAIKAVTSGPGQLIAPAGHCV